MRSSARRIALLLGGALLVALCGGASGQAAPTRWGTGGAGPDWGALQVQLRARAAARRHARCAPRAHASHGHKRCTRKARHGASSTQPTAGPLPGGSSGAGSGGGISPTLPGVPGPGGAGSGGSTGSGGGSGTGEEAAPPSIVHVQVVAVEYHYTLSRTTVPAGKVALQFVDNGQDEHNLNVLSGEGELETSFPNTVSKGMREQTVNLRKGSYTLFCSLPEHEAKGMHATLTVQ
jgi:plastocyanin